MDHSTNLDQLHKTKRSVAEEYLSDTNDNIIFVTPVCNNAVERFFFDLISSDSVVHIVLSLMFPLSFLYSLTLDSLRFWIGLSLMILLLIVHGQALFFPGSKKSSASEEKKRIIVSIILFAFRFYAYPQNKILLLPTMMCWTLGVTNKLNKESVLWGILPTYFSFSLFIISGVWNSTLEFMENGMTERGISLLCEGIAIPCALWIFNFYLIVITNFLKKKIETVEETKHQLEVSLETRNTFMSHVSHEFR